MTNYLYKTNVVKIVVTHTRKKGNSFIVEVLEGTHSVHKEEVRGIKKRDEIVWKLADLYGAVDIEIVDEPQAEFKFSEIPSIPVIEEEEADEFFEDNQELVYERIVQAVQEALFMGMDSIRLFELNGTDVYMTSNRKDWKTGLEQAINYYVKKEAYEKCIAIKQLIAKL